MNNAGNITENNSSERYLEVLGIDDSNFSSLLHQAQSPREPNPAELPVVINKQTSLEGITQGEIKKQAVNKMLSGVYNFGKGFVMGHFAIPSYMSCNGNGEKTSMFYGGFVPALGHVIFGGYPIGGYLLLAKYTDGVVLPLLATQITTNIISGIWEWYKYEERKLIKEKSKPALISTDKFYNNMKEITPKMINEVNQHYYPKMINEVKINKCFERK